MAEKDKSLSAVQHVSVAAPDVRPLLHQRLWDLVRQQRMELLNADLITGEEYAELARDHAAVARLEAYDALRATIRALEGALIERTMERDFARADAGALLSAIEPFAKYAEALQGVNWLPDACGIVADPSRHHPRATVGDLRRAAAAWKAVQPQNAASAETRPDRRQALPATEVENV